ncbi:amidohydrolase [Streptomyces parvulus]|uniref:amidohydrolase n=1 Tax=Streptomyces parvulus TaxID=146923 RepID=UPI0037D108E5
MSKTLFHNATVFTAGSPSQAEAIVVDGDRLAWVGSLADAERAAGPDATRVDLDGGFVVPGFIDAHAHLLMAGQSLRKTGLVDAGDLAGIQRRLAAARAAEPDAARVLGRGWLFDQIPGRAPVRQMIDEVVSDVPVYLDANDFHSIWLNSAALVEIGITRATPDPVGGRVGRDPRTGEPDGMLFETAVHEYVWPALARLETDATRDEHLQVAFNHLLRAGVTGAVDLATGEAELATLRRRVERDGRLPMRVACHWFVQRTESVDGALRQVERASELRREIDSPWLRIAGIKIVADGVVDACTAAVKKPYADGSRPEPIWDRASLFPVAAAADAAGLQIAVHAIGDEASEIALDAIEHAVEVNGPRPRRHRIEHLEVVSEESVARLARLGVVASMQPVHADPAIQRNWRATLGDERVHRGYPWAEFEAAGARLAFGTDTPTAPYEALPNLYVATTRRSALEPGLGPNEPELAVSLTNAITHATHDAAYSCGLERELGRIETGMLADFSVIDVDLLHADPGALLSASVVRTVVGGTTVFQQAASGARKS